MSSFSMFSKAEMRRAEVVKRPSADELFQSGMDTRDIAAQRFEREADVLRQVTIERSARLGLPNPYEAAR